MDSTSVKYFEILKKYRKSIISIFLCGILGTLLFRSFVTASPFSDSFLNITGIYGITHTLGLFRLGGGDGNAGRMILPSESEEATLGGDVIGLNTANTPQRFEGNFFLESVGWTEMTHVELIAPVNMSAMTPWTLSGYAWNDNAGYIDFAHPSDGSYDGVVYTPGTKILSGYAWSDNLGYLPFTQVLVNTDFKNKTKILGNIGSKRAFDVEYSLGVKFQNTNTNTIINTVRKNIALLTRNINSSQINTSNTTNTPLGEFSYYKGTNLAINDIQSKFQTHHLRSVIIEGGNIYIDSDITKDSLENTARSIIAIKDANGNGGNIYIRGSVKNIYATLVAEGSIFSGDDTELYNDQTSKLTQLPKDQLYIFGSVISSNTIGGSSLSPAPVCPYSETNCNYTNAYKYDFNYFRSFDPADTASQESDKTGYQEYSLIIEIDPRINQSPPPGLENLQ